MNAVAILITGAIAFYVLAAVILFYGASRQHHARHSPQPLISVLIAARNEEKNLAGCLESLLRSTYPGDKFEIVVIDDRSTDKTRELAENFGRQYRQVRVVSISQRLENMSGKASALCQGMEHAAGEIILMTDADCRVPPSWMAQMVSYFTPEIGLVGGFTLLSHSNHMDTLFTKVQTLDWLYLLGVGAGAAGLGKPLSIIGNNFAFRREAYEAVGGYKKLGFSIIEDFALMRAIDEQTKWRVILPLDPQTTIASEPAKNWRGFYEQRQRWAAGGKETGWPAKLIMAIAFLGHLSCLAAGLVSWKFVVLCWLILSGADFLLLWQSAQRLGRKEVLAVFPLFEIYYFLYAFLFAPTALLPITVRWKGINYRWNVRGKIKHVEETSLPSI
jgi:cellulose synthase/poly-beta-1,6-N-acetylglucosamine synthase-like glycosyltransferase